MELDHFNRLMTLKEQSPFELLDVGDPLLHVLPPLYSETYCLVPLPDNLEGCFTSSDICDPLYSSSLPLVPHGYYCHDPPPPLLNELPSFDEINLHSSWDIDVVTDPVPLNSIPPNVQCQASTTCNGGSGSSWITDEEMMVISNMERRLMAKGRSKLSKMGLEELKTYFYMPITKAAKEMNVGLTLLKKRCRELGVPRWPHRKMKSLKSLIHNVQELGKVACEESIQMELQTLEEHRRLMEQNPEIHLTERTKKLRQAYFKANYKKRRAMQQSSSESHVAFLY